jgi:hypothetical protein
MAKRFETLRAAFKPWQVKVAAGVGGFFAALEGYNALCEQFSSLPKLEAIKMNWLLAAISILPWWAWLLVAFVYALFEYVRRNIPIRKSADGDLGTAAKALANVFGEKPSDTELREIKAQINLVGNQNQERLVELNNKFVAMLAEMRKSLDEQIQQLGKTTETEKATREAFVKLISDRFQGLFLDFQATNADLKTLAHFAANLAKAQWLEPMITEGEALEIPINRDVDPDYRDDCCAMVIRYVERVLAAVGGTVIGDHIRAALATARKEAETEVRSIPDETRPAKIDIFKLRDYVTADIQRKKLVAALRTERASALSEAASDHAMLRHQCARRVDLG